MTLAITIRKIGNKSITQEFVKKISTRLITFYKLPLLPSSLQVSTYNITPLSVKAKI